MQLAGRSAGKSAQDNGPARRIQAVIVGHLDNFSAMAIGKD